MCVSVKDTTAVSVFVCVCLAAAASTCIRYSGVETHLHCRNTFLLRTRMITSIVLGMISTIVYILRWNLRILAIVVVDGFAAGHCNKALWMVNKKDDFIRRYFDVFTVQLSGRKCKPIKQNEHAQRYMNKTLFSSNIFEHCYLRLINLEFYDIWIVINNSKGTKSLKAFTLFPNSQLPWINPVSTGYTRYAHDMYLF